MLHLQCLLGLVLRPFTFCSLSTCPPFGTGSVMPLPESQDNKTGSVLSGLKLIYRHRGYYEPQNCTQPEYFQELLRLRR